MLNVHMSLIELLVTISRLVKHQKLAMEFWSKNGKSASAAPIAPSLQTSIVNLDEKNKSSYHLAILYYYSVEHVTPFCD